MLTSCLCYLSGAQGAGLHLTFWLLKHQCGELHRLALGMPASFLANPSGVVFRSVLGGSRRPGILLLCLHLAFPPLSPYLRIGLEQTCDDDGSLRQLSSTQEVGSLLVFLPP